MCFWLRKFQASTVREEGERERERKRCWAFAGLMGRFGPYWVPQNRRQRRHMACFLFLLICCFRNKADPMSPIRISACQLDHRIFSARSAYLKNKREPSKVIGFLCPSIQPPKGCLQRKTAIFVTSTLACLWTQFCVDECPHRVHGKYDIYPLS